MDSNNYEAEKLVLSNILLTNRGIFFTAKELARLSGFPTRGSQSELRKAITELIIDDKCPIVGNIKGFAWATCQILRIDNKEYKGELMP